MQGEEAMIDRLLAPVHDFLRIEAVSGIFLVVCTLMALVLANSSLAEPYEHFLHTMIGFRFGEKSFELSLLHWINDGLMTIFFFVVGLEIKREVIAGELRDWRTALLPVAAAVGGMAAPALIFLLFEQGQPGERGWGIPTATDIAFVVGILALLGKRVPLGLKLFLLTLAIADDLGAIIVIAAFYSTNIGMVPLAVAILGMGTVTVFQRLGVWSMPAYVAAGTVIWTGMFLSGIHPTIAGVVLGFATPMVGRIFPTQPFEFAANEIARLPMGIESLHHNEIQHKLSHLSRLTNLSLSPLERLEHALHSWVAFAIMPLFALTNAAVHFEPSALSGTVAWAVAAGLVIGKPVGILAMTGLTILLGLGKLPRGVTWPIMVGGACLAGIGFTMSLFVSALAFAGSPEMLSSAKIGVFVGSVTSAILGITILKLSLPKTLAE
ncbi:Na+/H+ antiporter NhaA [bacterium]|nr:Na+/H+ antiporter NhaA [bacterium]